MKNLKKILAAILVIAVMVTAMVPAFASAASYSYKAEATALHTLGLYAGAGTTADLATKLTRENAVVMAIQLFKLSAEAKKISQKTALSDLKGLFKDASKIKAANLPYVDYAIQNGYFDPKSSFGPTTQITGKEYCTLLLKLMGYSLEPADESYAAALLADAGGLSVKEAIKFNSKLLIKDDAVGLSFAALKSKDFMGVVVAEGMVTSKIFTFDQGIKAGVVSLKQDPKPEGAVFWDDFENGLSQWTNETQFSGPVTPDIAIEWGKWDTVVDSGSHVLAQVSTANSSGDAPPFFMMAGDKNWVNYTVEAKVKPVSMPGGAINLTARYNSPADKATYYILQIGKTEVCLKKFDSNGMVKPFTQPFTPEMDKWYDMKMTVDGNTITCYLDGKLLCSYYDQNPIKSGRAGISGWGATPYIDSFSVVPGPDTAFEAAPVPVIDKASNGSISLSLDKTPKVATKISDFVIKQKLDGVDTDPVQILADNITANYDLKTALTFTVPAIEETDAAQKVTYYVTYAGQTVSTDVTVPASTTPRLEATVAASQVDIGSSITVTAVNYDTTAVKYQIYKGTTAISDVTDLGKAAVVYPAQKADDVVTVKVLAADGTTVIDTKDVTLK